MRILHIEKMLFSPSGVTSVVRALSDAQRRGGNEVWEFSCKPPGSPGREPEYYDFATSRNPAAIFRLVHNSEGADRLAAFLRDHPVDVAHVHNIYHHLTPSILPVLARSRVGIVMTAHDYRLACPTKHFLRPDGVCMRCWPNRFHHAASGRCAGAGGAALAIESLVQRFFRRYFSWVDVLVCPSRFMRSVLVGMGAPAGKVTVAGNPVEPPSLPGGVRQDPAGVLSFGRLSPEKGPDLMLDLAEAAGELNVVVAGDGPVAGDLRAEAERRGLTNVTFLGQVAHHQLGRHLASAGVVVLPSRCLENSPQSMLEAMAAGRCVVVPDHPPLREWVEDGRTGRTFRSGDADSLKQVVREALADLAECERMARAGQVLVRERHDPRAAVARMQALYEEAIRRCVLRW